MANTPGIVNMAIEPTTVASMSRDLAGVAKDIQQIDPALSRNLSVAASNLFCSNGFGQCFINPFALGQSVCALDYLVGKSISDANISRENDMWSCIHPKIVQSSKKLFVDGHYAQAAVDAFIEFNDQAKSRYKEVNPGARDVPDGRDLMNKLLSPKRPMLLAQCDVQGSERDYQEGLHQMASGAMAALRNPKSHSNEEELTKEEAMRRLMFASLLMYKLDECSSSEL